MKACHFGMVMMIMLQFFARSSAQCLDSFQGAQTGTFYVWSDNRTDAKTAGKTCSSMGGRLAQIGNNFQKSLIRSVMQQKYNQELLRTVKVYVRPSNSRAYKYRAPQLRDQVNIESFWNRPSRGDVRSFKLFQSATGDFSTRATFCFVHARDAYRGVCDQGWGLNFNLFGGTPQTEDAITLRHVFANTPGSSRFLLPGQPIPNGFTVLTPSERNYITLTIPDNSVFIGARSDVGETSWFWSDRTMVTDSDYPTSDASVCQQMSWPLTYNSIINLLPKQCQERAYFACEFNFIASIAPAQCNGSILQLSWNQISFSGLLEDEPDFNVEVTVQNTNINKTFPYNIAEATINGLAQRTRYSVDVRLFLRNCQIRLNVQTTVSSQTSYGLPDPVTSATAQNTPKETSICIVTWKYDPRDLNITSYKILTSSTNYSSTIVVDLQDTTDTAAFSTDGQLNNTVDLSQHGYNNTVMFQIQAVSCQGSSRKRNVQGFCTSPPQPPSNLTSTSAGVYAGIAVAIVLLILLIIIAVLLYKRLKKSRKPPQDSVSNDYSQSMEDPGPELHDSTLNIPLGLKPKKDKAASVQNGTDPSSAIYENFQAPSNLVWIKDFEHNYFSDKEDGFKKLKTEFKEIQTFASANEPPFGISKQSQNTKKNRYKNIYPYDHSCIKLYNGRYINASAIQDFNGSKSFIATQGPKPNTVNDFWEMIWMQNSRIIVMLCNCVEKNKTKCEQYWPSKNSSVQHGDYKIKSKSEKKIGEIIKRTFSISNEKDEENRTVVQFHFISWPDHDVPITTSGMTLLRILVNSEYSAAKSQAPIVLHCSAGAGRTGTYIAVDNCMEELDATGKVDVVAAVLKMRKNRKDMVQTANQYIYVHQLLLENYILPSTDILITEFSSVMSQNHWEKKLEYEFQLFSRLAAENSSEAADNVYQNESFQANTNAWNQVNITLKNQDKPIKMDAHFINSTRYPGSFIAASSPRAGKELEFWSMIVQHNANIVVALESTNEDVLTSKPRQDGEVVDLRNVMISIQQVTESNDIVIQKLRVSFKDSTASTVDVTHVLLRCWNDTLPPPSVNNFLEIISKIKLSMEVHSGSTALVYCLNGRNRTGLFLAVADSTEQIKTENKVDIFRTIKDLKDWRCGMVDTLELYKACYLVISEYLATNAI